MLFFIIFLNFHKTFDLSRKKAKMTMVEINNDKHIIAFSMWEIDPADFRIFL